jgi:hypothetical protein
MTEKSSTEVEQRQSLLNAAIDKLEIQSVLITESKTYVRDGFSPDDEEIGNYVTQAFVKPTQCGTSVDKTQYGFKVAAGIRLVHRDDHEKAKTSDTDEFTCAEVKAHFVALYQASDTLSREEEDVFHQKNAVFHVWPYWREFVQQMGWRMGIPYLQVKMLKQNSLSKVKK